ncbi:MAG: Tol-Pal system beta propeller repeat protein TolB [Pseudomonadota bacterium]
MKRTLRQSAAAIGWIAALWLAAAPAGAQLVIDITQGADDALPIAVVPLGWAGGGAPPFDIANVVRNDLARSGKFDPMAVDDMIERPSRAEQVDFADWALLGADVLVVGELAPLGADDYVIEVHAFNVFSREEILANRLPARGDQLRQAAHRVADLVYEAVIGEPGVFSTRIAYVTKEGDIEQQRYSLVVADADGENPVAVLQSGEPILSPAWSPDARQLAYVSFEKGTPAVYVQDIATQQRRAVTSEPGVNGAPAWSPDGRRLALTLSRDTGNLDVYVLHIATGNLTRMTTSSAIDTEPTWSGDGRMLYFTSDRSGGPQAYRMSADGGSAQRVTFEGIYNARPRVSPDQGSIAVVHNDRGRYRIGLVDLDTRSLRVLTDGALDESPSFAPNGSMLIYASQDGGKGVLRAVSVDGRFQVRLGSLAGDVREPVWSPLPK